MIAETSEKQKMLNGDWFNPVALELRLMREQARQACAKFNGHPSKGNLKHITRLFNEKGEQLVLEPGFQCDYGTQITVGENFFANFNCVLLDSANIVFGNDVLLGPNVHIYTVDHPRDTVARRNGLCIAKPVVVGNDVWVGAGVKILPGVTIGDGAIIGANALVRHDVASNATVY
ncbi:sugar O-acetyltransferase [Oceaniserpentilla sp. 4NH20-0058]|uniref:sugar O-acetyltransferase n=1 Tax=Oceaniserpentilla sp. 4NH20-0058 TaxID=3127660 RepID=UPI0031095E2D